MAYVRRRCCSHDKIHVQGRTESVPALVLVPALELALASALVLVPVLTLALVSALVRQKCH